MRINNNYNSLNFTSLNNPIKPFSLKTNKGKIKFKELDYRENNNSLYKELATFFLDNFARQSSHPFWKKCRKGTRTFDSISYKDYRQTSMIDDYKSVFTNPDTTVLIGRNKSGQIASALITTPLDLTSVVKNDRTLYVDSLAVNRKYRRNHIGEELIKKVVNSTKDRFDDVFLVAYNESVPFYEKIGFKILEEEGNEDFISSLAHDRLDYPKYASFMHKWLV